MNIGFDMMGGDYAPLEAVKSLQLYLHHASPDVCIWCIGDEQQLNLLFENFDISTDDTHLKIVHAPQVIGYNEHPTRALKEKQQSSIAIGFHLLSSGKIDAFISAGNTGAMLVGTMYTIKAIDGIMRPAIATLVPKLNGSTGLLLDVGLNADCKPEQLNQFATLGAVYAKNILGIDNPTVGLLNVGEEEGKGNVLTQAAYPLLKENTTINFAGNVEGRDILTGTVNVVVCDGFTGNVILKMAESFYNIGIERNFHKDEFISRFHYENYGGTPVLGVSKPVIIGHGISTAKAFQNMILLAEKMITTSFCDAIRQAVLSEA